jgi:hypothetical protein
MANSYTPLERDSLSALGVDAPTFAGVSTSFYATSSFVYTLFFVAIVGAAFYQYTIAGIHRMEASQNSISKSNDIIKRVTLGLLGVFSLFLILFTVNKGMLRGDIGLGELGIKPVNGTTGTKVIVPSTRGIDNPTIPKTTDDPIGWEAIRNDSTVRATLKSYPNGGIGVNRTVCMAPALTSCTTVGGLPPSTISMLLALRNQCSGTIEITGGSEAGHKSHGPGKTAVDLSVNSAGGLNDCIRSFPRGSDLSYCKKTYENFGYVFCDENGTPHWHVFKK